MASAVNRGKGVGAVAKAPYSKMVAPGAAASGKGSRPDGGYIHAPTLDHAATELADAIASKARHAIVSTKRHVNAVTDQMVGTMRSWSDADGLVTAFGVFWMTQYLENALPYELVEAARVDGCSLIRTFWHVAMPAARSDSASIRPRQRRAMTPGCRQPRASARLRASNT